MKRHYQYKLVHLMTIIGLAIGLVLLFVLPATASPSQSVINPVLHQQENDFFKQGREKFEREIQLLLQRSNSVPEDILKISPEIKPIQEQLAPQEKTPQVLRETTINKIPIN
jgi:hypothetical protein